MFAAVVAGGLDIKNNIAFRCERELECDYHAEQPAVFQSDEVIE